MSDLLKMTPNVRSELAEMVRLENMSLEEALDLAYGLGTTEGVLNMAAKTVGAQAVVDSVNQAAEVAESADCQDPWHRFGITQHCPGCAGERPVDQQYKCAQCRANTWIPLKAGHTAVTCSECVKKGL